MLEEDEDCRKEIKSFLKIDLEGANLSTWGQLKPKLSAMILELLDSKVNNISNLTIKEEFQRTTSNLIEYANSKLEKASIDNQKLVADIENILANKAKNLAETRKLNAEAEEIELNNILKKLSIALGLAKAIAKSTNDPEIILFTSNIEELAFVFRSNKLVD